MARMREVAGTTSFTDNPAAYSAKMRKAGVTREMLVQGCDGDRKVAEADPTHADGTPINPSAPTRAKDRDEVRDAWDTYAQY